MNDLENTFKNIGINIYNQNGEMKTFQEIIEELKIKWNSLNKEIKQ